MIIQGQLLSASNLNNAYISKTDTNSQTIASDLTINGGQLTLTNSVITDNANTGYLRIDPQGNKVIIYDGVNNQELDVYSSSGSEYTRLTTINSASGSYGLIDLSSSLDHLEINTGTKKDVKVGGNIRLIGESPKLSMAYGDTNSTPLFTIGEQGMYGLGIQWDSGQHVNFLDFYNTSIDGTPSKTAGTHDVSTGILSWNYLISANAGITSSSNINITGTNSLNFSSYGGGFFMQDSTWIRTSGGKSLYHSSGEFRTDGTLEVGSGGVTLKVDNGGNFNYNNGTLFANKSNNIGIGTTSPTKKLHLVMGSTRDGIVLESNGDGSAYSDIILEVETSSNIPSGNVSTWYMSHRNDGYFSDSPASSLEFYGGKYGTGGYYAPLAFTGTGDVILASNKNATQGNVGIGTTTPAHELDVNGNIQISKGSAIYSTYNNQYFIKDFNNGNITHSAVGGSLYLGYNNTTNVKLYSNLVANDSNSNHTIADVSGKLYYQGNDIDTRYVNATGNIMTGSLTMNTGNAIIFNSSAVSTAVTNSTPTGLSYGRLQSFGQFNIMADTDGSHTEHLILTAGYGATPTDANGLSIGYNLADFKWQNNTIWHAGNDGANSGLDADLIHGQTPFIQRGYSTSSNATDLNSSYYSSNGMYSAYIANIGNIPSSAYQYGTLTVFNSGASSTQLYVADTDGTNGGIWYRTDWNDDGTWGAWKKIWTDHNDGSGSGLDADKLQGVIGSNYTRNDQGNTMLGDLLIQKNNPWLTLDSSGTGGNGVEQGAGISIGENGYKGSASLHLTYTGDGYGHIGMGTVDSTSGLPAYEAIRLYYTNSDVTFYGNLHNLSYLYGQYGTMMRSTDEWLRINDDASHSSGVYFGNSLLKTDKELQVGNNGMYFDVSASTFTYSGNTVWHAGNDGSGSTLDADKLDGKDSTEFMWANNAYGYYGLETPTGSTSSYIRTTSSGLIPYNSGGASTLGTSTWNFNTIYGATIYEGNSALSSKYLGINAKASDSDKLDNLDSSQFLRSDTFDTMSGQLTISDGSWYPLIVSSTNISGVSGGGIAIHANDISKRTELSAQGDGSFRFFNNVYGGNIVSFNTLGEATFAETVYISGGIFPELSGFVGTEDVTSYPEGFSLQLNGGSGFPSSFGTALTFGGNNVNRNFQLFNIKDTNDLYIRHRTSTGTDGTAWVGWNKFWHDGNDGSGSNLDADKVDGRDSTELMWVTNANGYDGISSSTATDGNWIRTTKNGFIPYQSGGGSSSLGSPTWPFKNVYAESLYGPLMNLGRISATTGRSVQPNATTGLYSYGSYNDANTPVPYGEVIGWGRGTQGSAEMLVSWNGEPKVYVRSLRDTIDNWTGWREVWTEDFMGSGSGTINVNNIIVTSTDDASSTSTSNGIIVGSSSTGVKIDTNEISSYSGGSPSGLFLNPDGGEVTVNGSSGGGAIYGKNFHFNWGAGTPSGGLSGDIWIQTS